MAPHGSPRAMEYVTLNTGAAVPALGLGTWQAGKEGEVEAAVDAALETGWRFIDTAFIYGNEHLIGKVLGEWLSSERVTREELFISTKLPMIGMRPEDVPHFLGLSLDALKLDYVDLYLIHVPFGILRDARCESTDDIKDGLIGKDHVDMDTDHIAIWKAMEAEVEAGRVRAIGLSNFNRRQIERILAEARIPPANLQIEHHLHLQQSELVQFCLEQGISVTAYSPLGSPGSTWLTATGTELPDLLSAPEVVGIAERYGKSPAQVLLRHIIQKGLLAVPKSSKPERLRQNIDVFDFSLDEEEMGTLNAMDRGEKGRIFDMRLMKGVESHPEYPWPEHSDLVAKQEVLA